MSVYKKPQRIAILGATGHVGQALFHEAVNRGLVCHGYVRDLLKASNVLPGQICKTTDLLFDNEYDVLINAISANDIRSFVLFETLELWDYKMIEYAKRYPHCCCVNISSGAVYGDTYSNAADDTTSYQIQPNRISPSQYYGLVKLLCEQRHRSLSSLKLVDLRLFAFFTRYIDLSQPFFMSDVINAIKHDRPLVTTKIDFERDYIHPKDFFNLILLCADSGVNASFDLYSKCPVSKSRIIAALKEKYGLSVQAGLTWESKTGIKSKYYSKCRNAEKIGYIPRYTSLDVIMTEAERILKN